ncbi:unnamed protein product, partial [Ectocarpus fasciculatus]
RLRRPPLVPSPPAVAAVSADGHPPTPPCFPGLLCNREEQRYPRRWCSLPSHPCRRRRWSTSPVGGSWERRLLGWTWVLTARARKATTSSSWPTATATTSGSGRPPTRSPHDGPSAELLRRWRPLPPSGSASAAAAAVHREWPRGSVATAAAAAEGRREEALGLVSTSRPIRPTEGSGPPTLDKLVGMSAAMEALGKALEKVLKQLHRREKPIGETFKAALGILDAAAVKLGIGGAGEITDGVSIGQGGTAWPTADSNTVFVWALCDKEESSISRPGTSSDNHTVRATRALVELCCPGEKAGMSWFGFNFNPFLCVRQDDACDVEHVGVGGAFVRLVMLATLAAGGVTVNRCLSLTSVGSKDGGGGFALEGLRNHLPPCVVHTLEGGFELAAQARNPNSRVSHPTTYQPVGARSPALVATVVPDALVEVLRLRRECKPSAELNQALQKFLAGLGVPGARKMLATATAPPTPAPREVALAARSSARAAIAALLGGGEERVEELFRRPTAAEAEKATEAGNRFVADVASKVWDCAGDGVTPSGIVVGEGGGTATTFLSFNSQAPRGRRPHKKQLLVGGGPCYSRRRHGSTVLRRPFGRT